MPSEAIPVSAELPATVDERPWPNHDLHTHTTWSDGAHSVALTVLEARASELDLIAITDHYYAGLPLAESDGALDRYLAEIDHERRSQSDVVVLAGAEATALDARGTLSIDARRAARLEWLLCDLGGASEGTLRNTPAHKAAFAENVLRTYLGLCDAPRLDGIAHPFNTGNTQPALLPSDYPTNLLTELADKMAARGVVFDVMNNTIFWFSRSGVAPRELTAQYVELVHLFAERGVMFQVSSDDHRTGLGNTRWSEMVLRRATVPRAQVVDVRWIAARSG